ncbi:ArsR/SmtB family transcription factor [Sphingomicrobium flavum]|uniref:ArsR/SmtB family transcription factor n=1 Tax=Sphingomicrobium flavum TaxID=1229164 RepID=UPI0035E3E283
MALARSIELSVGELANVLGQSQPRVSRHLRILDEAGLIRRRREGAWVFIELDESPMAGQLGAIFDGAANDEDQRRFDEDSQRLSAVRAERAANAARWFEEQAEDWDRLRSLHIEEGAVEEAIARLLARGRLGQLVDIGTGTGRMVELFAPLAEEVVGIDRSPEMLRLARVKLDDAGLANVSLRQGDMTALPLADGVADSVILHLVLHYAETPAQAIGEAARILAPGGQLVIADFAPHEHEELRKEFRHRRLGFSDEAMAGWFEHAGLEGDEPIKLEGGELTVSLWRASCPRQSRSEEEAA